MVPVGPYERPREQFSEERGHTEVRPQAGQDCRVSVPCGQAAHCDLVVMAEPVPVLDAVPLGRPRRAGSAPQLGLHAGPGPVAGSVQRLVPVGAAWEVSSHGLVRAQG
ncbi:hypothetical protein GCM10010255_47940 [Streptomyces coeruleofuscus]|uniref:Uncharacterized protein n=1 Tax=Streptomyces coeruleofuscus TaxID=66879 RepID=A0ABP5VS56_9ACTN